MEKKQDFMKNAKIKKVIGGEFKRLSLVIENGKFPHFDKNQKVMENDIISINPNMIFEIEQKGDEDTLQFVEAVGILAVSRQVKQYIMNAFLKNAVVDIAQIHATAGEIDEESGRKYSEEEYSYRLISITFAPLNGLVKTMILNDINNQTVLEIKKTVSAPNVFNMNQNVVL